MCLFPCMTCHVRERIRDAANKRTLTGRKLTAPGLFLHFHCVESPMPGYGGPAAAICVAQLPMLPSAASDSVFIPFSVRDCGFLQSPVEDLFELNRL